MPHSSPALLRRLVVLLGIALAVVSSGCAAHRQGDVLRAVRFEGNTPPKGADGFLAPQNNRNLRNAISQPAPSRFALLFPGVIEPAWLDESQLARDGLRLEVWYANHGYFDARFTGWEVQRPRVFSLTKRKIQPVVLVGHIFQGQPSRVRAVNVTGLDTLPGPLRRRLESEIGLAPGDIFDRDTWQGSVDALKETLQERSFAHARVTTHVDVSPIDHVVDVSIDVFVGPSCRIGDITLAGLERLPEKRVQLEVPLAPGDAWSPKALAQTRAHLFSLGTFATVNVVPDPTAMADDTARVIPVSIVLREGKFRSLEAGPAVQVESGEQRLTGDVGYRDTNLGGLGWQFEQTVTAGLGSELPFGEIVTFDPKTDLAPIVDLKGKLTIPHVGLRNLSFTQTGQVLLDFKSGLKYFEPSWSPGLSLSEWPVPHTALGLDYRVSYFTVVGTPGTTTEFCDPTTNQPITDDAFLSMVDESVSYSSKNDLFEPNRGWVWQVDATQAGGLLGGDSDFLRGRGSVVKYTSIPHLFGFNPDLWVVAARVGGGIIQPYGDTSATDVPWSERLFLGGGSSVRGWPARELGPMGSLTSCDSTDSVNGAQPRPDTGPIGGDLSLYGNLEMRVGWFHDFGLAVFTDMGQVWATPGDFTWLGESGLQVSFGGGIRYHSPIGTIRVDITRRLGTAWRDAQPPVTPDLALTEAF